LLKCSKLVSFGLDKSTIAWTNTLAYYGVRGLLIHNVFIVFDYSLSYLEPTGACIIKLITAVNYGFLNKLECLSLASLSSLVLCLGTNPETVNYGRNKFYDTDPWTVCCILSMGENVYQSNKTLQLTAGERKLDSKKRLCNIAYLVCRPCSIFVTKLDLILVKLHFQKKKKIFCFCFFLKLPLSGSYFFLFSPSSLRFLGSVREFSQKTSYELLTLELTLAAEACWQSI
jgi:hypothetical protein